MKATIVDLRTRMHDILKALDRNETVEILYHGKVKGIIHPVGSTPKKKRLKVQDHPFFGMNAEDHRSVEEIMDELRGGRFRDL